LEGEESDSIEEHESEEEEPHTPVLRRSVQERRNQKGILHLDFHSIFFLSITDDDPRTIREAVDSKDGKLWKKAMVEEMEPWIKMRLGI
jgi:hypothetical protein